MYKMNRPLSRALALLLAGLTLLLGLSACAPKQEGGWIPLEYSIKLAPLAAGDHPLANLSDGKPNTFFEGRMTRETVPTTGNILILDLGAVVPQVSRIRYTPRQDSAPGGRIQDFKIYTSARNYAANQFDGTQRELANYFDLVGVGSFDPDSGDAQTATFPAAPARYVVIQAPYSATGGDSFSAAELEVFTGSEEVLNGTELWNAAQDLQTFALERDLPALAENAAALLQHFNDAGVYSYTNEARVKMLTELRQKKETVKSLGQFTSLPNGGVWLDTGGAEIQAHGGSILYAAAEQKYYWYGEDLSANNLPGSAASPAVGIRCYSSSDLLNWTDEGLALPVFNNPQLVDGTPQSPDLPLYLAEDGTAYQASKLPAFDMVAGGKVPENGTRKSPVNSLRKTNSPEQIAALNALYADLNYAQRKQFFLDFNWDREIRSPRVVYNDTTKQYVLWWHEGDLGGSRQAMAAVAVSESPTGPFRFLHAGTMPVEGQERVYDLALLVDADKTGWLVYTSDGTDGSRSLCAVRLDENYTMPAQTDGRAEEGKDWNQLLPGGAGAPVLWQEGDAFHLLLSGNGRLAPAQTKHYISADGIFGKWKEQKAPAQGDRWNDTFHSQPTAVLPCRDEAGREIPGRWFLLLDRWEPYDAKRSAYQFLPLLSQAKTHRLTLRWADQALPSFSPIGDSRLPWILGGAGAAILLAGAAVYLLRRKKTRNPNAKPEGRDLD
ncbi:MAG: hypothetical protein LBJ11_05105 [Oscillospiraceae bacterium]|jgi:hypothetical protein|nr:hypothetical protein [Oscillospiraceae bacterium]